ncbi:hemerythrin domain-containing protein [Carboxylicivirga linearis]|uniref:Hemerythrin domain-containing protein n=1 Tax=Carboxylicivirga linearis TaxID=1628157 RepID=A0ABS5K0G4_9BACT|nr:hemerythrin domain-containing protein [Carboxylicivirga linearis]MBS2100600.1 hemerythrin domain-containing protein [Carboxylicivirga linearis]
MHITGEMKMVDVVQKDIQLLAVIQRLNIPLGFREKSVKEVCQEQEVDLQFFLSLANAFHDKEYFKVEYFKDFPVTWLINYLKSAHKCYIEYRIPEIERQIINLEKQVDAKEKNMGLLLKFFRDYIREFTSHIEQEEANVFPYIIELADRIKDLENGKIDSLGEDEFSITGYLDDHNNIEETLFDLKNILLKFLPPPVENCEYNNLIYDIFRLESDLLDHADMEEGVLFPRVHEMEYRLNEAIKKQG